MGILDIFNTPKRQAAMSGVPQPVVVNLQPAPTNNPGQAIVPNTAPGTTGTQVAADQTPPNPAKASSPLDNFSSIWDNPATPQPDPTSFKFPQMNPAKIQEAVGKMDFMKGIDPAVLQKATSGDAAALAQVINQSNQAAFSAALQANSTFTSNVFDGYDRSVNARIPVEVNRMETRQQVGASLEALNHPSVAPLVETVRARMESSFPDAGPMEIASHVQKYFKDVAGVLTTNQSDSDNRQKPQKKNPIVTDFSDFDTQ